MLELGERYPYISVFLWFDKFHFRVGLFLVTAVNLTFAGGTNRTA